MRVYLDICALQRPLDDQSQLRIRLEAEAVLGILAAVSSGVVTLVASDMHYVETLRNSHPDRRDFALEVLHLALETAPLSGNVTTIASRYVGQGVDPPDALHLAAAVELNVDFFCTTDDKLLRRARSVDTHTTRVVTPLDLATRLEEL